MKEITYPTINDAINAEAEKQLSERALTVLLIIRRWHVQTAETLEKNLELWTSTKISRSRVYAALKELENHGMVHRQEGETCRHYTLTKFGKSVANGIREKAVAKAAETVDCNAKQSQPSTPALIVAGLIMFGFVVFILWLIAQAILWLRA